MKIKTFLLLVLVSLSIPEDTTASQETTTVRHDPGDATHAPEQHVTTHAPDVQTPTVNHATHASDNYTNATHATEEHANGTHVPEEHANTTHNSEDHANTTHAPEDHANTTHAPEDHANTTHAPEDHANTTHAPEDHANTTHAPEDHVNTTLAPEDHANTTHAPDDHANTTHAPEDHVKATHSPEDHPNTTHTPENHANGTHVPEDHANTTHATEAHANAKHVQESAAQEKDEKTANQTVSEVDENNIEKSETTNKTDAAAGATQETVNATEVHSNTTAENGDLHIDPKTTTTHNESTVEPAEIHPPNDVSDRANTTEAAKNGNTSTSAHPDVPENSTKPSDEHDNMKTEMPPDQKNSTGQSTTTSSTGSSANATTEMNVEATTPTKSPDSDHHGANHTHSEEDDVHINQTSTEDNSINHDGKPSTDAIDSSQVLRLIFQEAAVASCIKEEVCAMDRRKLQCNGDLCGKIKFSIITCLKEGNDTLEDNLRMRYALPLKWACGSAELEPDFRVTYPKVFCEGSRYPGDIWVGGDSCILQFSLDRLKSSSFVSPMSGNQSFIAVTLILLSCGAIAFVVVKLVVSKKRTGMWLPTYCAVPLKARMNFRKRNGTTSDDETDNVHFDMSEENTGLTNKESSVPSYLK